MNEANLTEARKSLTTSWRALRDLPHSFDEYEWLALFGEAERRVKPVRMIAGKPNGTRYYFRLAN